MSNNVVKTDYGYEVVWAESADYQAKFVVFEKSGKTPIYMHKDKNKSWFINNGNFRIRWIDTTDGKLYQQDSSEGVSFNVPASMPVSLECLGSNGSVTEVSNSSSADDYYIIIPAESIGD